MENSEGEPAVAMLHEADLAAFVTDGRACWVRDIHHWRILWANTPAQMLWRAESTDELYQREVTPLSRASETRLWEYHKRVSAGAVVTTQWTIYPKGQPTTVLTEIRAFGMDDGKVALFFAAVPINSAVCPEGLRMLDAARHSEALFSLYRLDGTLLEQNASFLRELVGRSTAWIKRFGEIFDNAMEGEQILADVIAKGDYRSRVKLATVNGARWHMLLAHTTIDPVTGGQAIQAETVDITDQVEAETRARNAEQLLQRIADEFAYPVAFIAADKSYRFANRMYCNWVGRSRESVMANSLRTVAGAVSDESWDMHWPRLMRGERISEEHKLNYAGQRERWVNVDATPFRVDDGPVEGALVFLYDVHALRVAQSNLRSREIEMLRIGNSLPVAVVKEDLEGRIVFANSKFCAWVGRHHEAVHGGILADVAEAETVLALAPLRKRALDGETATLRRRMFLGEREVWLDFTLGPAEDDAGKVVGVITVASDVTKRVLAEKALAAERNTMASHLDNTPLAVIELDANRRIKAWTGSAASIFSWSREDAFGHKLEELRIFDEEARARFELELDWLDQGVANRFTLSFRNLRRDGTPVHAEWYGSVLRESGAGSRVTSYLMLLQDTSAKVAAEHHLQYVANHDLLTGLANRSQFQERLETDVARAHRHQRSLAVVLIDLDRFKYVNDSLGHQIGDILLQHVAARLTTAVGEGDLIARAGGDEFMVLIDLAGLPARAQAAVELIRAQLSAPFRVADQDVYVTASIGVALYPNDADNATDLVKHADWAMFCAKDSGRDSVQFFASTMANDSSMRLTIESDLRRALEMKQLELHYQAKVDIATGRMTGAEALLRWRHPGRGLIPPDSFVPIAEESGLILDIGAWVISESCRQLALWRDNFGQVLQLAINVSAVQLKRSGLAHGILAELRRYDLPGSALMVEVTETSVVTDPLLASESLQALRNQGVHAAIDDFGKGFSSLIQLKRLPIDALKIDGSFIRDLSMDNDDAAIVNAIIGLGHNLGLKVIAECVENPDQLAFLRKAGCNEAQGYLFSRPLPPDEFAAKYLQNAGDTSPA